MMPIEKGDRIVVVVDGYKVVVSKDPLFESGAAWDPDDKIIYIDRRMYKLLNKREILLVVQHEICERESALNGVDVDEAHNRCWSQELEHIAEKVLKKYPHGLY